jgi:hemerythrin-like domain-containing protein
MPALDILMNEHRVIEQVLDCLDEMAERARKEGRVDAASARDAVEFFRNFADRCHHGKEEDRLFPAMESQGFPAEQGPIGVMRVEHDQGRALVGRIEQSIEGAAEGRGPDVEAFIEASRSFSLLLRDHINKEDHCLFPMAQQSLRPEQQQELLQDFARFERDDFGDEAHARLLGLAEALAERFGVPGARVERAALLAGDREEVRPKTTS